MSARPRTAINPETGETKQEEMSPEQQQHQELLVARKKINEEKLAAAQLRVEGMTSRMAKKMDISEGKIIELALKHAYLKQGEFVAWVKSMLHNGAEQRVDENIDKELEHAYGQKE